MNIGRFACVLGALLGVSCAGNDGMVMVQAEWNLTCPSGSAVGCGSLGDTCLGSVGQRAIVGSRGEASCSGDPIDVTCEAIERSNGTSITLKANIRNQYAFELDAILNDNVVESFCNVTIIEDQAMYDFGACGMDTPSPEQPCQLSSVSTGNGEVVFDLQCDALVSKTSGLGFDVGAVGGGPATIRFANCTGF